MVQKKKKTSGKTTILTEWQIADLNFYYLFVSNDRPRRMKNKKKNWIFIQYNHTVFFSGGGGYFTRLIAYRLKGFNRFLIRFFWGGEGLLNSICPVRCARVLFFIDIVTKMYEIIFARWCLAALITFYRRQTQRNRWFSMVFDNCLSLINY